MADTSELEAAFQWTRAELTKRYGVPFTKKAARLRQGSTRTFNAVADDESIVAHISHSSGPTSGGKKPSGKIQAQVASLYFLAQTRARRRLLVLTDAALHALVVKELDGALDEGAEVVHVPLPPEMAAKVRAVTERASDEMT